MTKNVGEGYYTVFWSSSVTNPFPDNISDYTEAAGKVPSVGLTEYICYLWSV